MWVLVLLAGVPVYFLFVRNVLNLDCFHRVSDSVTRFLASKLNAQ
jgi:hypothetical protein